MKPSWRRCSKSTRSSSFLSAPLAMAELLWRRHSKPYTSTPHVRKQPIPSRSIPLFPDETPPAGQDAARPHSPIKEINYLLESDMARNDRARNQARPNDFRPPLDVHVCI